MKFFRLFIVVILFHSANFATIRNAKPDSTNSFIVTEKHLSNDQETGKINKSFWNVELKTTDSKTLKMKSFKGKYVYLNFWGEWCPGCREEMPSIGQAYKKFKNKSLFIGLLKPHNLEKAKTFIGEQKINFPIVLLEEQFKDKFNFDGFPLSILIFPDGKTYLRVDEVNKDFFEENIK